MVETYWFSGVFAMGQWGQWELGVLVAFTSLLLPLLSIIGWLYMLIPLRLGAMPPGMSTVFRWTRRITPWSLISVFMLGVLVAAVKLLDLAEVIPGPSMFALVGLLVVSTAARAHWDDAVIWSRVGPPAEMLQQDHASAHVHDLHLCHDCDLLVESMHTQCPRCGGSMHVRKPDSEKRTWALLVSSALLFIPANVYPVMTVIQLGAGEPSTILAGVVHLVEAGMIPLALLILFASVVVPMLKMVILAFLLVSVRRQSCWRSKDRTRLYRIAEVVGAWSMVDIFLVAILAALVNLDALATIRPGIGATFFAAVVVLTMLAAHSFDPRLIWDNSETKNGRAE